MNRWIVPLSVIVFAILAAAGCSGRLSDKQSPLTPGHAPDTTQSRSAPSDGAGPVLWGYFDCTLDIDSGTLTALPDRSALFTANVTQILNNNPEYMQFQVNEIENAPDYIGVDLDVAIAHPFPGLTQYHGYDVRGVFMGNGSGTMAYNTDLEYPSYGIDQYMMDKPDTESGGPDGYTRWFNRTEFPSPQIPLFGYTHGKFATKGYNPTATLCPYKYFADEMASTENAFTWLVSNYDLRGRFSAGSSCSRNYYIRFPNSAGVKFGYAVIANWQGPDPDDHPSNALEAVAVSTTVTDGVYYVDDTLKGGVLELDIGVFDWDSTQGSSTGAESYSIFIESTVLTSVHELTPDEMIPTGGGEHYFTYHVEIPADNVTGLDGNYFWVIVECTDADYSNDFGVPNTAWDDPLAAAFRYDLHVLDEQPPSVPVCDVELVTQMNWPYEGWPVMLEFDASGSYSPGGNPLTFEWDFDNDGTFGDSYEEGTDSNPVKFFDFDNHEQVCVRVSNVYGEVECCVPVDLLIYPSKNLPLEPGLEPIDIGVRAENGDLYVLYIDHSANIAMMWRYAASNYYQSGSFIYSPPAGWLPIAMDVAPTGYAGMGVGTNYRVFSPAGVQSATMGLNPWVNLYDVSSYNDLGTWTKDLFFYIAGTNNVGQPDEYVRQWWHLIRYPNYDYASFEWCAYNYDTSTGYDGLNKTYYEWVKGVETDVDGNSIWMLEQPDYYATNWNRNGIFLQFTGEYFGDGTDSSWSDARDLARTDDNRFLVLDCAGGQAFVSVWEGNSSGGGKIGQFGDASTISEEPRRIDGSDYDGSAFVLHGDSYAGTDCYRLSIFFPAEIPD